MPRGGPDGGDGGRGGSVILRATRSRNTLVDFRWRRTLRAEDGANGAKQKMYGKAGEDLLLLVPIGTLIFEDDELLADLAEDGAEYVLPGGRGGRGNPWFATSTYQTPTTAEEGKPGIEKSIRLELKLLADVGLLGFPNAGKSTLISRISAAKPKIADYPFTTLVPHLGVVSLGEGESFVVADIPGLIEGASEGRGLGHQFLKHVERCQVFLHLVSCEEMPGTPIERVKILEDELRRYDASLLARDQLIVLTKCDTVLPEESDAIAAGLREATGRRVFPVSAVSGQGLPELLREIWQKVLERRGTPDVSPSRADGPAFP